jgi:site-specific DNA-methyltransferase (adenine-specific)
MTLLNGDCLALLPTLAAGSIDLILVDLPYGTTACKWDAVIPFAPLWSQYRRVAKKNAAMVFTSSQPFTTQLIASNIGEFRYCWVWEKEQGINFLFSKKQPMKVHEDVPVFYAAQPTYNPQMTKGTPYISGDGCTGETLKGFAKKVITRNEGLRFPRTVQKFNRETGLHPTQKPLALMEYLVRTYSNEGETVLDNCMGSGTTGVACAKTGRKFVGIELDPTYFEIAKKRIEEAEHEYSLVAPASI